MSRGNADTGRCEVYDDREAPFAGGLRWWQGKPIPESDPQSIHSFVPKVTHSALVGRNNAKGSVGAYTQERDELAAEMRRQGHGYVTLGAELGMPSKTLWKHLTGKGEGWTSTFERAAEIVDRPDLAAWARGQR